MRRLRLFTTAYAEIDPARRAELAECLLRNLGCPEIDEVCVLMEGEAELPRSGNLVVRRINQRPLYSDYFQWIEESAEADDVSVVSNADIYFDSQIGVLRGWTIPAKTALALSRWDVTPNGTAKLYDRNDSQDVWAFRGTPEGVAGGFPIGVPRCDNRFARELELAGYRVLNPSFSLHAYHLHVGARGEYAVEHQGDFVEGPYGYVWPHNLMPLHETLMHNARNRNHRVEWRVDKRHWRRTLRLHWLKKGFDMLARPFRGS